MSKKYYPVEGKVCPFAKAIQIGETLYISGQVGIDRTIKSFPEDIGEQTKQCILNLNTVLESCGFTLEEVVKVKAILTDKEDIAAFNAAYMELFTTNPPARTLMVVSGLVGAARVEIDAIAAH